MDASFLATHLVFFLFSILACDLRSDTFNFDISMEKKSSGCRSKKNMLPTCRITPRLTGIQSPGWRLFTDGGLKRNIDCTEMAGWEVVIVSPEHVVRVICGPVACDPRLPAFPGATPCSNNTAELTGLAQALCWPNSFIFRGSRLRILF